MVSLPLMLRTAAAVNGLWPIGCNIPRRSAGAGIDSSAAAAESFAAADTDVQLVHASFSEVGTHPLIGLVDKVIVSDAVYHCRDKSRFFTVRPFAPSVPPRASCRRGGWRYRRIRGHCGAGLPRHP